MPTDNRHPRTGPSHQSPSASAESSRQDSELRKINQALIGEREALKKRLADCTRMLTLSTTGLISLNKSGLIDGVNPRATEMLGTGQSKLLGKPISLFIVQEDQALFFVNRSRIVAGIHKQPFEIKFKTGGGSICLARVTAQTFETPNQQLPGILLAMEDITALRQNLESLQLKEYFINLLFSIVEDLSVWPTAEIDEIIIYCLEKVGLVSKADRVYVGLLHDRRSRLSITHQWLGEGIEAPPVAKAGPKIFSTVLSQAKSRGVINVADIGALAPAERVAHEAFHAAGTQSFLLTTLTYGHALLGIIGCDAVYQKVAWSREAQHLLACVGGSIVHALIRRQAEAAAPDVRETILQFVQPTPPGVDEDLMEYEGPIEIMDQDAKTSAGQMTDWHFEEGHPEDANHLTTALLKNGQTASIACKHCNRQNHLDIADIRAMGTRLKATCVCGKVMYIKIELRREHRKAVDLEGVFIRGQGDRMAMQPDAWGRIRIYNLSRHGIGFKVAGHHGLRVDDRFVVKFTLDNTAGSPIQKAVVVRSVSHESIGCQFEGQDPCDVTLGFYMIA